MYRLWNWLFGWDYVMWKNFYDAGVVRVKKTADGKIYYDRYYTRGTIIKDHEQVLWLTCHPRKYFPQEFESKNNGAS